MARISIPTTARLSSSLRLDASNAAVLKIFNRLARSSLLTLALDWLDERNQSLSYPYLRDEGEADEDDGPDDLYPPAHSLAELQELYVEMQGRKGSKREVIDRILEGDWRHGLSLYQLAMADLQYLYDHPTSQKWTAYRIVPLKTPAPREAEEGEPDQIDKESLAIPRFHPSTFLQNLQAQVLPDVKAHYQFDRPTGLDLLLLRIFILDSPYNTNLAASSSGGDKSLADFDSSRIIYIAFPDGSPHVYISKSQTIGPTTTGETRSLRSLVTRGIPKALSRPRERYTLVPTNLTTRSFQELLHRRGSGRTNTAGGGWSIYADPKKKESPLDTILPTPPLSDEDDSSTAKSHEPSRKRAVSPGTERDERRLKHARLVAQARFGDSGKVDDGKGVDRVDIVIDDPYPGKLPASGGDETEEIADSRGDSRPGKSAQGGRRSTIDVAFDRAREEENGSDDEEDSEEETWRPSIKLTFHGSHVFAGIRQLVEAGIIDGDKMPGWLTGEEGITIGAVRHGRIRGYKGSGI